METRWATKEEARELGSLVTRAINSEEGDLWGDLEKKHGWTILLSTEDTRGREMLEQVRGILQYAAIAEKEKADGIVLVWLEGLVWAKLEKGKE